MQQYSLKPDIEEAIRHFKEWWERKGLVAAQGSGIQKNGGRPTESTVSAEKRHTNVEYKAEAEIQRLEQRVLP
jgi:hypothetical protein